MVAWQATEYPARGAEAGNASTRARPGGLIRGREAGKLAPGLPSTRVHPAMSDSIQTNHAPAPVGAYPHARRVGDLLLLSGIGPRVAGSNAIPGNIYDAAGALVGHDIAAQTRQVLANVRAVLEAAGASWDDLVDVTVFLTDMAGDFSGYNAVWAEYFADPATAPCRTTLGIIALPTPIAIELKCLARNRQYADRH